MNNEFFINEVAKIAKREKQITKNLLARVIIHNLRKIKNEEKKANKERLLSVFKHKCLQKHYYKFLELYNQKFGAKRIENYFKNELKCSISKAYFDKVLKFLREQED